MDLIEQNMNGVVTKTNNTTAESYLYGTIGRYLDIDTTQLILRIEALRKEGVKNFRFYVNSEGGEVIQGQALFNYLLRTDIEITWIVDGVAASMMSMLMTNPKHKVIGARYSKYMYHRIQGYVYGNSNEVRAHADMIDIFEDSLINMMSKKIKGDKSKIKKDYFTDGADHWLSAQQALERGLIDEIFEGNENIEEVNLTKLTNKSDVFSFYNKQILNLKRSKMESKNVYALAIGLSGNDDETTVLSGIQNLVNENKKLNTTLDTRQNEIKALQGKLAVFEKAKITNLLNQAVADKKIGEDDRAVYEALAEKDFAGVETIINKMPKVERIFNKLNPEDKPKQGAWEKRQAEIDKA